VKKWVEVGCKDEDEWCFVTCLWAIWIDWNEYVINNNSNSLAEVAFRDRLLSKEIHSVTSILPIHSNLFHLLFRFVLKSTFFKLNYDGSSYEDSGETGYYGFVIKNSIGAWVHGASGSMSQGRTLRAELWGIWRGLCSAHEIVIKKKSQERQRPKLIPG
ncbi:hypothetical protein S245_051018, partial [Arachis hypogaea]